MEVIGLERVDYISKNGNKIKGVKLHMCYESEKVNGSAVMSEFVPERVDCNVEIGDKVELFYNKYGQVNKVFIS